MNRRGFLATLIGAPLAALASTSTGYARAWVCLRHHDNGRQLAMPWDAAEAMILSPRNRWLVTDFFWP